MRTTSPCIFFPPATSAAALLVLLLVATGPTPSWPDPSEFIVTFNCLSESFGTPDRYATIAGTSAVWVATTATPSLVSNASYNSITLDDHQDCTVGSLLGYTMLPYFHTVGVTESTSNPGGRTTASTTTTSTSRKNGRMSTATTAISATRTDPLFAATSRTIIFHDQFDGAFHEDTGNESRWRRFQHDPLRLPDQFMARFLSTLMYLAEVITADVISAFLFGRWRPRYYQRAKKNRLHQARRRRYRRFMMFTADVATMIWDACVHFYDTMCPMQTDMSRPTFQMVSNVQLTEYRATLSMFADESASEVVEIVVSARRSAIVSTASSSALTSMFRDLPLLTSSEGQMEATTADVRHDVSTYAPRLLGAPEMSKDASCQPRTSLPVFGLDKAPQPAVSRHSPLLLEAAPHTTGPLLLTIDATKGCAENNMIMPIIKDSSTETEWLAVLGINLLLEGLASPSSPASPSTRKHRPAIKASEPISGNAEGMLNSLVTYTTTERRATTPVEEFGGPVDDVDDTPLDPFFISERYTPESTCYVSAHGVAYTTITMSYAHRVNLPTSRGSQDDTPTTTQTGDVSDILFHASNAQLRCKWSRECMQTVASEYYRSSVEAVFVANFIPDETDMVVLSDLVTRHL